MGKMARGKWMERTSPSLPEIERDPAVTDCRIRANVKTPAARNPV